MSLVVLVTGGRTYSDKAEVWRRLRGVYQQRGPIDLLLHGAAPGADTLAEAWARDAQVNYQGFPAKWTKLGNPAGPLRNREMLEELKRHRAGGAQALCVAFPGGTGTAGMVRLCLTEGVEVVHG